MFCHHSNTIIIYLLYTKYALFLTACQKQVNHAAYFRNVMNLS